jgi:hypothetical protein
MSHTFTVDLLGLVSGDYHQKTETVAGWVWFGAYPTTSITTPDTTLASKDGRSSCVVIEHFV